MRSRVLLICIIILVFHPALAGISHAGTPYDLLYKDVKKHGDLEQGKYASFGIRKSFWSPDAYTFLDENFTVDFGAQYTSIVEVSYPAATKLDISLGVAIKEDKDGNQSIEDLIAGIKFGSMSYKIEKGSSKGEVVVKNSFDAAFVVPDEKTFETDYFFAGVGITKEGRSDNGTVGLAYLKMSAPARFKTPLQAKGSLMVDMVDPAFTHNLVGLWINVDSLKQIMHGYDPIMAKSIRTDKGGMGIGLSFDVVSGYAWGEMSPVGKETIEKKILPATTYYKSYDYSKESLLGLFLSYRLEGFIAFKLPDYTIGGSAGIEGSLYNFMEGLTESSSCKSSTTDGLCYFFEMKDGDSMFSWGPFVKVAVLW